MAPCSDDAPDLDAVRAAPPADQPALLIAAAAGLRRRGQADDAVAHLGLALDAAPDHAGLRAALALALDAAGQPALALATMIEVVLALADGADLGARSEALRADLAACQRALVERAVGVT